MQNPDDTRFLKGSQAGAILSVKHENAKITYEDGNPLAIQVLKPGGNSGDFSLSVRVTEENPDTAMDSSLTFPGDINLAEISIALQPIGPGSSVPGNCVRQVEGFDYDATLTAPCSFSNVPVNTYSVVVNVSGNYYRGGLIPLHK